MVHWGEHRVSAPSRVLAGGEVPVAKEKLNSHWGKPYKHGSYILRNGICSLQMWLLNESCEKGPVLLVIFWGNFSV